MDHQTMRHSKKPCDKMEPKVVKQKEEDALRQVSDLLQQSVAKNEDLLKKIAMLEGKVQTSIAERLQYEKSMNKEKQKWQKILDMKKRQIKMEREEFKRKIQELRKLQVQEKKIRLKIKILETACKGQEVILKTRCKELAKGVADHELIKELKEKCTTDLLRQFINEFFEAIELLGIDVGELDLTDLTGYMKFKRILLKPIAADDSS